MRVRPVVLISCVLLVVGAALLLAFTLRRAKHWLQRPARPTPTPVVVETPEPSPTPTPVPTPIYVPSRRMETSRLFNGLKVNATVEADFGTTATLERNTAESYALELTVKVKVPRADTSIEEIAQINSDLPRVIPALRSLLQTAKVDPYFDDLYRRKVAALNHDLPRLNDLLSRHNFFDCETILQMEDPATHRKALLIQSDMDVVMDGSDSDRVPVIDGSSLFFQPTTSYKWAKRTAVPNPFLAVREQRLKQAQTDLATPGLDPKRAQDIRGALPKLRAEVDELKKYSYLISMADPFVVVPGGLYSRKSPYAPKIGDYCVVIYKDMLYPAIVGDIGPNYKSGEASLRIAKEISPKANAYNRPASDLSISYLIFPGSADKPFGAPDLTAWWCRCAQLIDEIGGHTGTLFWWEDLTKPTPTPTPVPTVTGTGISGTAVPGFSISGTATPVPLASPSPSQTGTSR